MAALAVGSIALVSCGRGSSAASGSSESGELVVTDAWIRPTPPVSNVGAFYQTIHNDGSQADKVNGAIAPRCVEIEIHRTETNDDVAAMGEATPAELVVEPDGGLLIFEPSALHVMCLGLDEPVVAGESLMLTIEFDRAGPVAVEAVAENR